MRKVEVNERLYARVQAERREGESFSDALERMVDHYTLLDFADDVAPVSDAWNTEELETNFERQSEATDNEWVDSDN